MSLTLPPLASNVRSMADTGPLMVNCGSHGERVSAVVCRHMLEPDSDPIGFVENNDDPNDSQAWCLDCEDVFVREGGMTQAFLEFNGMRVVCVDCYARAKQTHSSSR